MKTLYADYEYFMNLTKTWTWLSMVMWCDLFLNRPKLMRKYGYFTWNEKLDHRKFVWNININVLVSNNTKSSAIELNFIYNMMYTGGFLTSSWWLVYSALLCFEMGHVVHFRFLIQMLFCNQFKKPYNISLNDLEIQLDSYIYLASMVIKIWTCISRWHITYTALMTTSYFLGKYLINVVFQAC